MDTKELDAMQALTDAYFQASTQEEKEIARYNFDMESMGFVLDSLEALRTIPSWIPVTERLPESMKPVLVMRKSGEQSVAWLGITQSEPVKPWFWGGYQSAIEATHWMELPTAPSQEKGGKGND